MNFYQEGVIRTWERKMKSITRLILVVVLIFSFVVAEINAKKEPVQQGGKESSRESHQAKELTADWDYKLRLDSKHFALFTTSPTSVAESIPEFAENVYELFCNEFGDTGMMIPKKLKIYLFNKKKEYIRYMESKGMTVDKTWGPTPLYSSYSDAVLLLRQGQSRGYLLQSMAHEITHSLSVSLFKSLYNSGAWVMEGIAYYVGMSVKLKKKRIILGEIHQTWKSQIMGIIKEMFRQKKFVPLRKFINMRETALKRINFHLQAFSLFHFLQEVEDSKYKIGFHRYLGEICTGRGGGAEVFEECVGKISEIEPAYLKYIRKLKPNTRLSIR